MAANGPIFDLIDHYPVTQGDRNWAYKGFFLEALDTAGVPFFATAVWPDNRAEGDQAGGIWATPSLDRSIAHG